MSPRLPLYALLLLGSVRPGAAGALRLPAGEFERTGFLARARAAASRSSGPGLRLVTFSRAPDAAALRALQRAGARAIASAGADSYLVWDPGWPGGLEGVPGVAATVVYPGFAKATSGLDPGAAELDVVVQFFRPEPRALRTALPAALAGLRPPERRVEAGPYTNLRLRLSSAELAMLLAAPDVVAVHPYREPRRRDERQDQILAAVHDGSAPSAPGYRTWLAARGLGSLGDVLVDVTDDGIDFADPDSPSNHPDLAGRIAYVKDWTSDRLGVNAGINCGGHGMLNAGIVAGDGLAGASVDLAGYLYGEGIAPSARVGGSKIFTCLGGFSISGAPLGYASILGEAWARGARISTNSWGAAVFGEYDSDAQAYDFLVRDANDDPGDGLAAMTVLFSAGNEGAGSGSVGSPGTAKNVITVGASENVRSAGVDGCGVDDAGASRLSDLISFSSRGPTRDGRRKPDLVAPGTHITNVAAQNPKYDGSGVCDKYFPAGQTLYALSSGTSHSTPAVAGAAALLFHERLAATGSEPSPALLKAALAAMGDDLVGGADGRGGSLGNLPDNHQGWGLVNLARWFDAAGRFESDQALRFLAAGESRVFAGLRVADPAQPVRVALAWSDAPGLVGSGALVNDLDLTVTEGATLYKGNVLSGGMSAPGGSFDRKNNLEGARLPGSTVSPFSIRVSAALVAGDAVPGNADPLDQDFALVVLNAARNPREGTATLDREVYRCDQPLFLRLEDSDLAGSGTATVELSSGREPGPLVATLVESAAADGSFTGSVAIEDLDPLPDDRLQVFATDTIELRYADADDGSAAPATWSWTAAVDCSPPAVTLLEPDGGEVAIVGSARNIGWSASDNRGVSAVDLELSTTGPGGPFLSIAAGLPDTGAFSWSVPRLFTSNAFVRVRVHDAAGSSASDLSDAAFNIRLAAHSVAGVTPSTSPTAGGRTVAIGGSNFTSGLTVRFGTRLSTGAAEIPPLSVSSGLVRVVTPAHLGGRFDLTVTLPDGQTQTLPDSFTFSSFDDVPPGDPFFNHVEAIRWRGITGGCSSVPPLYCPASLVTRGQMAVFLVRALDQAPEESEPALFLDVPPGAQFYGFIQRFAALGITGGCGGGNYCPEAGVTRGQMAVFLVRALGELPDGSGPPLFSDVPAEHPFYGYIQRFATLGITGGCGAGVFCPEAPVTRGQMAVFLTLAFRFDTAPEESPARLERRAGSE